MGAQPLADRGQLVAMMQEHYAFKTAGGFFHDTFANAFNPIAYLFQPACGPADQEAANDYKLVVSAQDNGHMMVYWYNTNTMPSGWSGLLCTRYLNPGLASEWQEATIKGSFKLEGANYIVGFCIGNLDDYADHYMPKAIVCFDSKNKKLVLAHVGATNVWGRYMFNPLACYEDASEEWVYEIGPAISNFEETNLNLVDIIITWCRNASSEMGAIKAALAINGTLLYQVLNFKKATTVPTTEFRPYFSLADKQGSASTWMHISSITVG